MARMTAAFAGEAGSFSEDAALACLGEARMVPVAHFRAVFTAVAESAAEVGVVPIENVS